MRSSVLVGMCCAVRLILPSMVLAQQPAPSEMISNGNLVHTLQSAPVTGQPYSAMLIHEQVRTLADGSTVKSGGHHFTARDSMGRTRTEMRMAAGKDGAPDTVLIFVMDPVAHTITTWVRGGAATQPKVASVVKLPQNMDALREANQKKRAEALQIAQEREAKSGRPQPVTTKEDLGSQTMDGVVVNDVKETTIVPAGRAGNSAPITKTHETWTSEDMKLILKEQWSDPRVGVRTQQLEGFTRAEPDPALFHAPKGYELKDVSDTLKDLATKLEAAGQ